MVSLKHLQGGIFLCLVILIWVASAVLIRTILADEQVGFNKPLFLTYFSTAFFIVYLFPLIFEINRVKNK
jgi:solute carrier family 35, member F5